MIQEEPDGYLDLWARGHYKSTIITFAKTIQDILASHGADPIFNPWHGIEPCFAIFSHTRPIAKAFLRQIREELSRNEDLKALFPDILWTEPDKEAPSWGEDSGLVVRRRSNAKEATVEAWGLIDGQPISKHYHRMIYDDVVTRESVTTPDQIHKTTDAFALSANLAATHAKKRGIGTRYHFNDTYRTIIDRGILRPRVYVATENGEMNGVPVLFSPEILFERIRDMGPYIAAAQLFQNPVLDSTMGFRREWFRHFSNAGNAKEMNRALLCDPANSKKKDSDYTVMVVIGQGPDQNYYLLDGLRDRLSLPERTSELMRLHRKWRPQQTGYEEYGMASDIAHIEQMQEASNYRFSITKLPLDGAVKLSKFDRINRLIPIASSGRLYLPTQLFYTLRDHRVIDLTEVLINEEFMGWPVPLHDDGMDAISRILDLDLPWPKTVESTTPDRYARKPQSSWMSR